MDDKKMWRPEFFEGWAESIDRTVERTPSLQESLEGAAGQLRTAAAQIRELDADRAKAERERDEAVRLLTENTDSGRHPHVWAFLARIDSESGDSNGT